MISSRAQLLVDQFEIGASLNSGKSFSIRHGLAAVLIRLADTEADPECFYAIPSAVLRSMADALTAPTLLERALAGDAEAARQFLHEGGFTDEHGNLLPHFRPCQD